VNLIDAKLDRVFSRWVIRRDGKCLACGRKSSLQCAHAFSRRNMATRWDEKNAVTLCLWCHAEDHSKRSLAKEIAEERLTEGQWDALVCKASSIKMWTHDEKMDMLFRYGDV